MCYNNISDEGRWQQRIFLGLLSKHSKKKEDAMKDPLITPFEGDPWGELWGELICLVIVFASFGDGCECKNKLLTFSIFWFHG